MAVSCGLTLPVRRTARRSRDVSPLTGLLGPGSEARNATVLGLNDVDKQTDLILRLQDEADLCRNDGASDIAALLDEVTEALRVERVVLAELTLKTGELIEHLQKTGRLKPCFYMPALADARNALAN